MDIGPRIVELLLALPEPSQRWLALLGPWSLDQRQGLLCLIAKVEPYDLGTGTPILGLCVSDHGPIQLVSQNHSGVVSFGRHLYSCTNFKLKRAAALAEWRQLLSA